MAAVATKYTLNSSTATKIADVVGGSRRNAKQVVIAGASARSSSAGRM